MTDKLPIFAASLSGKAYFKKQADLTGDSGPGLVVLDIVDANNHYYANIPVWSGGDVGETVAAKLVFADKYSWKDVVGTLVSFSIAYDTSKDPHFNVITLKDSKSVVAATITVSEAAEYGDNTGLTFFFQSP